MKREKLKISKGKSLGSGRISCRTTRKSLKIFGNPFRPSGRLGEKKKGKEKVKGEKERRCGRTCEKQPSGRKNFWCPFGG